MTDYQQAIAAARAAYTRLLREDCTAQACQLAEDALRDLLAAIDAAPTAADEALADTQRAIIEAAERRGYERGLKDAMSATREDSSRVAVTVPVRHADLAALAAADFGRSGWSAELEQVAVRLRAALVV